ncbi:MAG: hypothetical protein JWO41_29 [Candidatus Saccharibacteria bacterium]|nr:hypothetical protein [Candidatus Saccharibacteria bacterium]
MHDLDPGLRPSAIDTLLSDPAKQEQVREFFADVDAEQERIKADGKLINTVSNKNVGGFPAIITETGVVIEVVSVENPVTLSDSPKYVAFSEADIADAIREIAGYKTVVMGFGLDISKPEPTRFALETVALPEWSDLDKTLKPRNTFDHGGSLILFGRTDASTVKDSEEAVALLDSALRDTGNKTSEEAMHDFTVELAKQGAYIFIMGFKRNVGEGVQPDRQMWTGSVQSEQFSAARKRNQFEL